MNNIRYVIEWFECIFDEYYNKEIDDYVYGRIVQRYSKDKHIEIFEDETEFLSRKRELEDMYDECEIDDCYTCELQLIK